MTDSVQPTVAEAMRLHYVRSGVSGDEGREEAEWTLTKLGSAELRLTNFQWRKRALPLHDLHHVLTGYPCTMAGELQIAAWEFSAGRFPDFIATLFCLPLIGIGAITIPIRSFTAFVRGRQSKTLYAMLLTQDFLALSVQELRGRLLPQVQPIAKIGDLVRYLVLVSLSLALIAVPILILSVLFLNHG